MKKILGLSILIILVTGCSQVKKAVSSTEYSTTPPELTILVDDKSISAVQGTFSWINIESDSVAAPELAKYQEEKLNIQPQSSIILKSGKTPNDYKVFIWQENKQIPQQTTNGVIIAPQQKGNAVYEIYASWDEGSSYYAFSANIE